MGRWPRRLQYWLTSSYMNCSVRADFPTPPLPTMITLCNARELWFLPLLAAIVGSFFVPLLYTQAHVHTHTHTHMHRQIQPVNDKSGNISLPTVNNLKKERTQECRDRWQLLLNSPPSHSSALCQASRLCSNKSWILTPTVLIKVPNCLLMNPRTL